jgi:hypothetical protein
VVRAAWCCFGVSRESPKHQEFYILSKSTASCLRVKWVGRRGSSSGLVWAGDPASVGCRINGVLERARKHTEARNEKERKATERKKEASIWKAEKEARKADALAAKAIKLASRTLKTSSQVGLGKRKLVESTIEVGSSSVAKQVRLETSRGRTVITPAKLLS